MTIINTEKSISTTTGCHKIRCVSKKLVLSGNTVHVNVASGLAGLSCSMMEGERVQSWGVESSKEMIWWRKACCQKNQPHSQSSHYIFVGASEGPSLLSWQLLYLKQILFQDFSTFRPSNPLFHLSSSMANLLSIPGIVKMLAYLMHYF